MAEPVTLTAALGYDFSGEYGGDEGVPRQVIVFFGNEEIITLPPIRKSHASHGDDTGFFQEEERSIVEETVAPLLRRLFATVAS